MRDIICRFNVELEEILLPVLKGGKLLTGAKYLIREGELVVRNLIYNDTGQCTCAAKNIITEACGNLTVRSKKNIFFYSNQTFKQGLLQANLAV